MEDSYRIHTTQTEAQKIAEMRGGAYWFYLVAILAALSAIIAVFTGIFGYAVGFGISQFVDGRTLAYIGQGSPESIRWAGLAINLLITAAFALFGYYSARGSDKAFILGMFLYTADAMLILAYKEYFGFVFHLLALFYMFKGLLGSRKRFDPSV